MKHIEIRQVVRIATAVALLIIAAPLFAGSSATQTITFSVNAISEIVVSGNPGALTVSTATSGSSPDTASDSSTTYDITTNQTGQKITAAIDSGMPPGVTLKVHLIAPAGATSAGLVTLTASAADVVTGISTLNQTGLGITYTLSATPAAGSMGSDTRTVTLTITSGS
jgi:hypothetical protein